MNNKNDKNDKKSPWTRLLEHGTLLGIAAVITAVCGGIAIALPVVNAILKPTPPPTDSPTPIVTATTEPIPDVSPTAPEVSETPTDSPTPIVTVTTEPIPDVSPAAPEEELIESFEWYSSDEVLRAAYSINAPFNEASVSLAEEPNVYDGTRALAFTYDIHTTEARDDGTPTNYAGLRNTFAPQDWAGFNFLRLWVKSDGSNRNLVVQFREASKEAWEYTTNLDRFGEKDLELRLDTSEFQLAEWSPRVNGQIDLGAIVEFSVYVGEAGQGRGTIYIDEIRLSK